METKRYKAVTLFNTKSEYPDKPWGYAILDKKLGGYVRTFPFSQAGAKEVLSVMDTIVGRENNG